MRTFILKLILLCVILSFSASGCDKETDFEKSTTIFGIWESTRYPENCPGFEEKIIEISPDSVIKKYNNGQLNFTSSFHIRKGNSGYDTIFYHNPDAEYAWEYLCLKHPDTLEVIPPLLTFTFTCNHYYKRLK